MPVDTVKKSSHKTQTESAAKKMVSNKKYMMEQIRKGEPLDEAELKRRGIKLAKPI